MNPETLLTTFEDWTLRIRPPQEKPARVMLMLHGWTGDESSMWPFARQLPKNYWILAPRAPHPTQPAGYSWRIRASMDGFPPHFDQFRPTAALLADFLERWGIANAVDTRQVDVMGFSQGGAMTVTFALAYPHLVRKMAVLAGFAPSGVGVTAASQPLTGKKVFITHGTADEMVPIELARQSMQVLEQAGAQITYCESEVGHKVSADCLRALETFFAD